MASFTYNYYQLANLFVPNQYAFPNFYVVIGNASVQQPVSSLTSRYSITIESILNGDNFYETYSITASDDTTNTTIGTFSFVFNYTQISKASGVSQTLVPSLTGNILTASGEFASLLNGDVTVYYDNITGERQIEIIPSS